MDILLMKGIKKLIGFVEAYKPGTSSSVRLERLPHPAKQLDPPSHTYGTS